MTQTRPARVLIIAGSDSGGGAGLQADIKTASAFGAYAMTAVTAITAQDTLGVHAVHSIPAGIVREQIVRVLSDIGADAIKTGMLGSAEIIAIVSAELRAHAKDVPLVVDPVMVAKGGAALIEDAAIDALKEKLLPLAFLLTPNIPEAERLTGIAPVTDDDALRAAVRLTRFGVRHVLFKGGHGEGAVVRDRLVDCSKASLIGFESPRQNTVHTHGTGCTLATAIACRLGQGASLASAVADAHGFVQNAIRTAPGFGHGHGPLNHLSGWKP